MSGFNLTALCPVTEKQKPVLLPDRIVHRLLNGAPKWKWHELVGHGGQDSSVKSVLASPELIFSGNKRETPVAGFCYCGIPRFRFTDDGNMVPPPPNMIFLVHLSARDEAYDWSWEFKDEFEERVNAPAKCDARFEEHVWPKHLKIF